MTVVRVGGYRTFNSLCGYNLAADVLSYPPDESLEGSCIDLLKTAASYPLHEIQAGRFWDTDPAMKHLQAHLAMYVLKTDDALELRTEIHANPEKYLAPEFKTEEDPDLYYLFSDQPEATIWTCLFPWSEVWEPRRWSDQGVDWRSHYSAARPHPSQLPQADSDT